MIRYKSIFSEQTDKEEYKIDPEIKKIINQLKNDNFGNEDQRKKFLQLITKLAISSDKEARKFIKAIGNFCSDYIINE